MSDTFEVGTIHGPDAIGVQTHIEGQSAPSFVGDSEDPEDGVILVRKNISTGSV